MDGIHISDHILRFIRNRRIDSEPTTNDNPAKSTDFPRIDQITSAHSTTSSFTPCISDCARPSDLSIVEKSQSVASSSGPTCSCPRSTTSSWIRSKRRFSCRCDCRRCCLNQQLSKLYGIVLHCSKLPFVFSDHDDMLFNGYSERTVALDDELLPVECLVIECVIMFGYLPKHIDGLKTHQLHRYVTEQRNYLSELQLFSPKVSPDVNISCRTCELCDDGTLSSCKCRILRLDGGPIDWSDDSLADEWFYAHCDSLSKHLSDYIYNTKLTDICGEEFFTRRVFMTKITVDYLRCLKTVFLLKYCFHQQFRPPDRSLGTNILFPWRKD